MAGARRIERWQPIVEVGDRCLGDGASCDEGISPTFVIPVKAGIQGSGNACVPPASAGCGSSVVRLRARRPRSREGPCVYPEAPSERAKGMTDARRIERWLPTAEVGIKSLRERTPVTPFPAPNQLPVWRVRPPQEVLRDAAMESLPPEDADRSRSLLRLLIRAGEYFTRQCDGT